MTENTERFRLFYETYDSWADKGERYTVHKQNFREYLTDDILAITTVEIEESTEIFCPKKSTKDSFKVEVLDGVSTKISTTEYLPITFDKKKVAEITKIHQERLVSWEVEEFHNWYKLSVRLINENYYVPKTKDTIWTIFEITGTLKLDWIAGKNGNEEVLII